MATLILGLLIAAIVLFVVDAVNSRSLVSAGLACVALAGALTAGG